MSLVLGIESSCDETAAAVVEDGLRTLSSVVLSQEEIHAPFSGVVPEMACRAHVESILPVVLRSLEEAGIGMKDLGGIAVANRPGLVGALLVGVSVAKALAFARDLPLVGVDHIEAHLHAVRMEHPDFVDAAMVGLVVSGGHTSLYLSRGPVHFERLGSTVDDAAGEAFDKVAKMTGLAYPGGPVIDRLARAGNRKAYDFPRALLDEGSLDFSFSGLKTAVLYACKGRNARPSTGDLLPDVDLEDVAASFQEAVVDVLLQKIQRAVESTGVSKVGVGGGVACNSRLRERLHQFGTEHGIRVACPRPALCSDNAAMIAGLGGYRLEDGVRDDLFLEVAPTSRS